MFFRNKLILSIVLSLVLILGACGSDDTENTNTSNESVEDGSEMSASEREAGIDGNVEAELTPLSESFDNHKIWYLIGDANEVDKESKISYMFIFEDDLVTKIPKPINPDGESIEFQEIVGLSDEDVIDYVANGSDDYSGNDGYLKESPYEFIVKTDGSGNNTEYVNILTPEPEADYVSEGRLKDQFYINILDGHYTGFELDNTKPNNVFITSVKDESEYGSILLDEPDRDNDNIEVK